MAERELTELEQRFLANPPPRALARIATVGGDGMPHVVPGGWSYDPATNELILGGRDVLRTRRARNVAATGVAAVVIDGVPPGPGWSPWAFIARGRARLDPDVGAVRVAIDDVRSWQLEVAVAGGGAAD